MQSGTDRGLEIVIAAAVLFVIVPAGVNSQSFVSSFRCDAPYVSALCGALGHR